MGVDDIPVALAWWALASFATTAAWVMVCEFFRNRRANFDPDLCDWTQRKGRA